MKIFISYSSKNNKAIAGEIKKIFEEYDDIKCFVAHDDIPVRSEWVQEILKELDKTDYFMPIHTEDFKNSYWCQQEVGYAFAKEKKIVPLIPNIGGTDPVGFIAKFQGLRIKIDNLQDSIEFWLIKENIIKKNNMDEIEKGILILSKSNSYNEAGIAARTVLKFEEDFNNSDIIRIVNITLGNPQVRDSFEARKVLESFFKRHSDIIPKEKLEEFLK